MIKIIVFSYIKIIYLTQKFLKIKLKGLGRIQRLLGKDFVFLAYKTKFQYDHRIEGSYDYLLIGKSNEPETRKFLDNLIPQLNRFVFIDVGASIGEFINLVSTYRNNVNILAFEPRQDCVDVLIKNATLNQDNKTEVFNMALSNKVGEIEISLNAGGSSTGIYALSDDFSIKAIVKTSKLDDLKLPQLYQSECEFIMLIDVEGAEPLVLEGALEFIYTKKPLIIFEYNNTSKKYFNLNDIYKLLGEEYAVFRMNGEGKLDSDLENTWNCVAIPKFSVFQNILFN
jgi:FkbM family methyltransferase